MFAAQLAGLGYHVRAVWGAPDRRPSNWKTAAQVALAGLPQAAACISAGAAVSLPLPPASETLLQVAVGSTEPIHVGTENMLVRDGGSSVKRGNCVPAGIRARSGGGRGCGWAGMQATEQPALPPLLSPPQPFQQAFLLLLVWSCCRGAALVGATIEEGCSCCDRRSCWNQRRAAAGELHGVLHNLAALPGPRGP